MKKSTITPTSKPSGGSDPVIEIENLHYAYDGVEAVQGVNLRVERGTCHALFGRNGAGKTTTLKCLLDLLRPQVGRVRVFGLDPSSHEVEVKSRLAYVPDSPAFYPWMTVGETLDYMSSFRPGWNAALSDELVGRFGLRRDARASALSKGQRTQLALVSAVAAMPELLVLDEPTSGLDPIVRREFIETVIGSYQESDPGRRTILVSTHLISEFEGLIDAFTLVEDAHDILHLTADEARDRYRRIRARFETPPASLQLPEVLRSRMNGRELELIVNGNREEALELVRAHQPVSVECEGLSLEEIFMHVADPKRRTRS